MTVVELLAAILKAYPGANPEALAAFRPVYFARFGKREGPHLQQAFNETLADFKPKYGQPFPIPADFERHMPSLKLNLGKDAGPKLDLDGRKKRADSLFWNWHAGQGRRASKDNPALMRALENVARPIANTMGWQENPEPLVLTRDQLKTAAQRAISFERLQRHGQPPRDMHVWWGQIKAIADGWGLQVTPEWWDKETGETLAKGVSTSRLSVITSPPSVMDLAARATTMPPAPSPEMKVSLLKAAIRFNRDMGFVEAAEAKERELAELEAKLKGAAA